MTTILARTAIALVLLGTCAFAQGPKQTLTGTSSTEQSWLVDSADASDIAPGNVLQPTTSLQYPNLELSRDAKQVPSRPDSSYYWSSTPVGDTAQLLTLFCRACNVFRGIERDVPVVSVLRDTLGDQSKQNDRVTYIWLLSYVRPSPRQRLLSAVPFFYWRVSKGSGSVTKHDVAPLMDLSTPENSMMAGIERNLIQWTAFDPLSTPARAVTREYGANSLDDERLHLEEAINYLRQAPTSKDATALTQAQLDSVIARLKLHEPLLGGLADDKQAERAGMQSGFELERIRMRNSELLRQWAEKSGLIFEALNLGGNRSHYAVLWFPQKGAAPPASSSLHSIWKLLGIRDPWNDSRLQNGRGRVYERALDENDPKKVIPLAVYSLDYPKQPLILMDFRGKLSRRRREVAQRSTNEVISGVLGISRFADWYVYIGIDLHRFVAGRRGAALDEASRLDCYSDFRINLALDRNMDPSLKTDMETRIRWLAVNPLEAAPKREIQYAVARYQMLVAEAGENGRLAELVDQERRFELASFGESEKARLAKGMLHVASLGHYKQRAKRDDFFMVDRDRRVAYQLNFLDSLIQTESPPEISYDVQRIESSVRELSGLMPNISSPAVRSHADATLEHLRNLSKDYELQADCTTALALIKQTDTVKSGKPARVAALHPDGADAFSAPNPERMK